MQSKTKSLRCMYANSGTTATNWTMYNFCLVSYSEYKVSYNLTIRSYGSIMKG